MRSIAYVGLDVHRESIVVMAIPEAGDGMIERDKIPNEQGAVEKWFRRLSGEHTPRCCYEASSCGYVMHRWLTGMGVECEVIAPSLTPRRAGERVKTDKRDALKLARLYRSGELTTVYVPTGEDESVRGLLRCRETMVREVTRSKQYISSFLTLRGIVYREGNSWTQKHWRYLKGLKFEGADETVFQNHVFLLEFKQTQLADLDRKVEEAAGCKRYKGLVGRLSCLRGIGTLSAMYLISEVSDFSRFGDARRLMAYFGLVPCEVSSGESRWQGGITKTGSSRCRRILTEAAWHYQRKPSLSKQLKKRQEGQPMEVIRHAWKAQQRLHDKFWGIALRKDRCKAAVAVARELVGFIWAIAGPWAERGAAISA